MTVFVSGGDGVLTLRVRGESDSAVGDLTIEIRPGEEGLGKTYAQWVELGPGAHEIDFDARDDDVVILDPDGRRVAVEHPGLTHGDLVGGD